MGDMLFVVGGLKLRLKIRGYPMLEFLAGINTAFFKQIRHLGANAFEPHEVGPVNPFRQFTAADA